MNKIKKAILAILLIITIPISVFFALYLFHVMVYLKPEPLKIRIINEDIKDHNLRIEVIYEAKKIFNKSFNIKSNDKIFTGEISKKEGEYIIIATLDNKIREEFTARVGFSYSSVDIFIVNKSDSVRIEIYQKVY